MPSKVVIRQRLFDGLDMLHQKLLPCLFEAGNLTVVFHPPFFLSSPGCLDPLFFFCPSALPTGFLTFTNGGCPYRFDTTVPLSPQRVLSPLRLVCGSIGRPGVRPLRSTNSSHGQSSWLSVHFSAIGALMTVPLTLHSLWSVGCNHAKEVVILPKGCQ